MNNSPKEGVDACSLPSSSEAPESLASGRRVRLGGADGVRRPEGGLDAVAGSGTIERKEDAVTDQTGPLVSSAPARAGPQARARRGQRRRGGA
jgi:hypothetical protein